MLGIIMPEVVHHRQRQALYYKLGDGHRDETNRRDTCALLDVTRHHTTQGSIRDIVRRVNRHQQHIRDGCVDGHHCLILNTGIIKGKDIEHTEGHGSPKNPWPEFTPACLGAVG